MGQIGDEFERENEVNQMDKVMIRSVVLSDLAEGRAGNLLADRWDLLATVVFLWRHTLHIS